RPDGGIVQDASRAARVLAAGYIHAAYERMNLRNFRRAKAPYRDVDTNTDSAAQRHFAGGRNLVRQGNDNRADGHDGGYGRFAGHLAPDDVRPARADIDLDFGLEHERRAEGARAALIDAISG